MRSLQDGFGIFQVPNPGFAAATSRRHPFRAELAPQTMEKFSTLLVGSCQRRIIVGAL